MTAPFRKEGFNACLLSWIHLFITTREYLYHIVIKFQIYNAVDEN